MEFVVLFIAVLIGAVTGWYVREMRAQHVVTKMVSELEKKVEEEKKNAIKIKLEKHHEHIYVFEDETDKFLGQAETIDELDKYLADAYPGKRFLVRESDAEAIGVKL